MSESGPPDGEEPHGVVKLLQTITPTAVRRSFAIKFGLALLIMALSIGSIGMLATATITDQTEQRVEDSYRSGAAQEANIIEQWVENHVNSLQLISDSDSWETNSEDELTMELRREFRKVDPDVQVMHLLSDDGGLAVVHSHSKTGGVNIDASGRDWFDEELRTELAAMDRNEVHVSETYEVDGTHYVGFLSKTPVEDRYFFMEVAVGPIGEDLEGSERADGGFTLIVNENTERVMIEEAGSEPDNRLLDTYGSSEASLEPVRLAAEERVSAGDTRGGVIAEMDPDPAVIDEVYTVGYSHIEGTDWVLITHAPRSSVFGTVDTLSTWGLITTVFAVLLIGVTGAVLGYSTATSIDRLTRKTDEIRQGNLDVPLSSSRIDTIGQLADGLAGMRDSLKQQIEESERSRQEAENARKEAEVARAEAEELATYLQEKAGEYSEIMGQVAAGDLTQRMTEDGEEESMDQIATEFNEMIAELEKTTGQLKSYVDEVEEAGAEVEQSANTVREASEQVADSVQTISDDASNQKERLREVSTTMDDAIDRLEELAERHGEVDVAEPLAQIREVSTAVTDVAQLSEESMAEAENVAGAAEEQAAELNEVSERAHDLQRYAQPLRNILQEFDTEAEHEFVFSVGPTGGVGSPGSVSGEGGED